MAVVELCEHKSSRPLHWVEVVQASVAGLAVVLLVVLGLLAYRGSALGAEPPSAIIVVVVDATRADRLSCYGYTANPTPNISALAHDGVLYRNMSTQAAWTKASVATLLTSMYPSSHRAAGFEHILPDEVLTVPEIMTTHGYRTVGYVTNPHLFPEFNFQQGFQEYRSLHANETTWNHLGYKFYQEAERVNWHVLRWLEANQDQRFFMYVHYMDPHRPYFVHPYEPETGNSYFVEDPTLVRELSDAYDSEIAYFDQHFGNLLDTLKRLGLYDDALIVLTSDHGEEFYEHQGWAHGKTLYQEITHVPLIIKYPGNARAGTVDEGLASSLDIAPTILDVAGIEAPATMQGVSLRLPPDSPARPQAVFAEDFYLAGFMAARTSRYKLIQVTDGDLRGRAPVQLYDLETDPGETTNLAADRPDIVAQLQAFMGHTLALAEQSAVGGREIVLDPELVDRLRRLGY